MLVYTPSGFRNALHICMWYGSAIWHPQLVLSGPKCLLRDVARELKGWGQNRSHSGSSWQRAVQETRPWKMGGRRLVLCGPEYLLRERTLGVGAQASSGLVLGRRASSVCLPSSAADRVRRTCGLDGLLEGRVGAKGALGIGHFSGQPLA